ncbi:MAG TPA: hypothetical protein VGR40_02640 [Candidatus Binatus sp.]|nr:hypothetical protein [Candidatus Binatus sp.]
MLTSLRTISILIVIAAAFAAPAYAQESAKPNESPYAMRPPTPEAEATMTAQELAALKGTPGQQALARKVADAMTNDNYGALKDAIAPSTLKCIGEHQDFLQDRIKRQFELPMSRKFKLTVTKLPPTVMRDNKFSTYPMLATHLMGMEFTTEDGRNATVNLPIGEENGKWYEVQPCPTQLGLERFAKLQKMQAQRLEQAKAAMAKVKDPVKSQLLALIGKHDQPSAWNLCMKSLHFDFQTCHGLVELLAGEEPD